MKQDKKQYVKQIKTVYHIRGNDPKVLRSKDANRAVTQCVRHMMINHYGSHVAEVYDDATGELHAQIKRNVQGTIAILFQRDPSKYETRFAMSHLIGV